MQTKVLKKQQIKEVEQVHYSKIHNTLRNKPHGHQQKQHVTSTSMYVRSFGETYSPTSATAFICT